MFGKPTIQKQMADELYRARTELLATALEIEQARHTLAVAESRGSLLQIRVDRLINTLGQDKQPYVVEAPPLSQASLDAINEGMRQATNVEAAQAHMNGLRGLSGLTAFAK